MTSFVGLANGVIETNFRSQSSVGERGCYCLENTIWSILLKSKRVSKLSTQHNWCNTDFPRKAGPAPGVIGSCGQILDEILSWFK